MGTRLYVGNLPFKTTNEDLTALFGKAGPVEDVQVMTDLATGRARGFAFVQMGSDEAAQKAISEFHQYSLDGRTLVVNEARPRMQGGPGSGAARGGGPREPRQPRW
jgi:RNA recognition motif-containing protein